MNYHLISFLQRNYEIEIYSIFVLLNLVADNKEESKRERSFDFFCFGFKLGMVKKNQTNDGVGDYIIRI